MGSSIRQKCVAKVLLFDDEGNVLVLIRNSTHPNFPSHLDFPGGEVEPGEQAVLAVIREVKEEADISLALGDVNLVYEKHIDDHLTYMLFEAHIKAPKPIVRLSWEHADSKWMSLDDLRSSPVPANADKYYLTVVDYLASLQKR